MGSAWSHFIQTCPLKSFNWPNTQRFLSSSNLRLLLEGQQPVLNCMFSVLNSFNLNTYWCGSAKVAIQSEHLQLAFRKPTSSEGHSVYALPNPSAAGSTGDFIVFKIVSLHPSRRSYLQRAFSLSQDDSRLQEGCGCESDLSAQSLCLTSAPLRQCRCSSQAGVPSAAKRSSATCFDRVDQLSGFPYHGE